MADAVNRLPRHGTYARYQQLCRCARCREANRVYLAAWRERNPEARAAHSRANKAYVAAALAVAKRHPVEFAAAIEVERAKRGVDAA